MQYGYRPQIVPASLNTEVDLDKSRLDRDIQRKLLELAEDPTNTTLQAEAEALLQERIVALSEIQLSLLDEEAGK